MESIDFHYQSLELINFDPKKKIEEKLELKTIKLNSIKCAK